MTVSDILGVWNLSMTIGNESGWVIAWRQRYVVTSHYLNSCWTIPQAQYTSTYMQHQGEMSQLTHLTKVWP